MPRTILLVDDDPVTVTTVAEMLRRLRFRVIWESNPSDALAICQHSAKPFDLLITDIYMPDMDGWELACSVRAGQPGIPVLYMTGDLGAIKSLIQRKLPCLYKPFRFAELETAVLSILGEEA